MRAAVAVAASVGELRATHRLDRATALDGRRVEQHKIVEVARTLLGEAADEPLDRVREAAPALVEAGLLRQLRDEVAHKVRGERKEMAIG